MYMTKCLARVGLLVLPAGAVVWQPDWSAPHVMVACDGSAELSSPFATSQNCFGIIAV